jgi:hypothetical protein
MDPLSNTVYWYALVQGLFLGTAADLLIILGLVLAYRLWTALATFATRPKTTKPHQRVRV